MFTGIVETFGEVVALKSKQDNLDLRIKANFTHELKIDQSVAHNGVCLTVVAIEGKSYTVTAVQETLTKTNLSELEVGDEVNLERCMSAEGRFDGHMVYGHVDCVGSCIAREDKGGSTLFTFSFPEKEGIVVEKGSISINGISLTVWNVTEKEFSVAIIPYTIEHTNLKNIEKGHKVNLEFDIFGKYVDKYLKRLKL